MILYFDTSAPALIIAVPDGTTAAGIDSGASFVRNGACFIGTDASRAELAALPHLISLLPVSPAEGALLPVTAAIAPDGRLTAPQNGCRVIDWGSAAELCVKFRQWAEASPGPSLLMRTNFPDREGRRRNVELYSDSGIRLNVPDGNAERSLVLCGGTDAEMRVLDVGRERLLVVHAKDGNTERLIALNTHFEIAAQVEGSKCAVDDGYLTAITPLTTVLGHEKRVRYELRGGRLDRLPDEIGFFSHTVTLPSDAAGAACALMEAVMLEREDEIELLMSRELRDELELTDIRGFFGEFDECRPVPWQITGASVTAPEHVSCGAIKNDKARIFGFTVENGKVTDITED